MDRLIEQLRAMAEDARRQLNRDPGFRETIRDLQAPRERALRVQDERRGRE